jgi:hypothetical protein
MLGHLRKLATFPLVWGKVALTKEVINMRCELCEREIAKGANWVQVTFAGVIARFCYQCFFSRVGKRAGSGEQAPSYPNGTSGILNQ